MSTKVKAKPNIPPHAIYHQGLKKKIDFPLVKGVELIMVSFYVFGWI